jgi:hypothetical protein
MDRESKERLRLDQRMSGAANITPKKLDRALAASGRRHKAVPLEGPRAWRPGAGAALTAGRA